jgi:hypothetical protein
LAEWLNHAPKRPVGIIFMDFATIQKKEAGWEDHDIGENEEGDLIQSIINMNYST